MKRGLAIGVLVLSLGLSTALAKPASTSQEAQRAASAAITQSLGGLLAKRSDIADVRISACSPSRCKFRVAGTARCEGVARVEEGRVNYRVWAKSLDCR